MTTESHHLIAAALTRAVSITATARGQNESPVADSPMDGVYLVQLAAEVNRLRERCSSEYGRGHDDGWGKIKAQPHRDLKPALAKLARIEALPELLRNAAELAELAGTHPAYADGIRKTADELEQTLKDPPPTAEGETPMTSKESPSLPALRFQALILQLEQEGVNQSEIANRLDLAPSLVSKLKNLEPDDRVGLSTDVIAAAYTALGLNPLFFFIEGETPSYHGFVKPKR